MEKELNGKSSESLHRAPSDIERAFAVDVFDTTLRAKQKEIPFNPSDSLPYYDQMNQITASYIADAGISSDDSKYPQLYDVARKYSVDTMNEDAWQGGIVDPSNPDRISTPGSWKLQAEQTNLFGRQIIGDGSRYVSPFPDPKDTSEDEATETTPEKSLNELNREIETLREDVNGAFAKRMKVGFFARKKKQALQEQLDEKKTALSELTKERNNLLVDQLRSEGLNDEQIVEKLAEQSNAELQNQGDGQRRAMLDGNFIQRKINSGFDKYANTSTKNKLAIGALTALALVPAGFAVGAAAGVAGAAGAGGLLAARTYKTYQMSKAKLYASPGSPDRIEYKNDDEYRSVDDVLADANTYSSKAIDERIEKGDKVKKKAVIVTLGSLAIIGVSTVAEHSDTIGAAANTVGNKIGNGFGSTKEAIAGWFNRDDIASGGPIRSAPQPSEVAPSIPEVPGVTPDAPVETTPPVSQPEIAAPAPEIQLPPAGGDGGSIDGFNIDQYTDALNVAHGEGWYSTFGELGITNQADQAKLLNNDVLMAKLSNMNLAYVDNKIGGWGIRMPADGKMPADALKLIRETAQQGNLTLSR